MNLNQAQARYAGIVLVLLGIVAIFNLWWMIPAALLAGGGFAIYRRQRVAGRRGEAVQALLWGVGLAVLLLADFIFPGVLLLGGASLLLRGREAQFEDRTLATLARLGRRRAPAAQPQPLPAMAAAQPPVAAPAAQPQQRVTLVDPAEQPAGSETIRLR